jgi:hypothetical protein
MKFHIYVNVAREGEVPQVAKALEYEENTMLRPGDIISKQRSDGLFIAMVFEIHRKPETNEFVVLAGRPFRAS